MYVRPGQSVGPFVLGSSLHECIAVIQADSRSFKEVNVVFDLFQTENPSDIVIDLCECGMTLRFDRYQQRLRSVDVYDFSLIPLFYFKQQLTYSTDDLSSKQLSRLEHSDLPMSSATDITGSEDSRAISSTIDQSGTTSVPCSSSSSSVSSEMMFSSDDRTSRLDKVREYLDQRNTLSHIIDVIGKGMANPGICDERRNLYYLEYPGVWCAFHLNVQEWLDHTGSPHKKSKPDDRADDRSGSLSSSSSLSSSVDLPVELDDGISPPLRRMVVFFGDSLKSAHLPGLRPLSVYMEPCLIYINQGVRFGRRQCSVYFGSSVQDVITDVGTPDSVYYRRRSKSKLESALFHSTQSMLSDPKITGVTSSDLPTSSSSDHSNNEVWIPDYIYNYRMLGMDIVFDGSLHCVKKFILHNNLIAHGSVDQWCRNNFVFVHPRKESDSVPIEDDELLNYLPRQRGRRSKVDRCCVNSGSQWSEIVDILGPPPGEPLIFKASHTVGDDHISSSLKRDSSSERRKTEKNRTSSCIHAYRGVLFEVIENFLVANVTLFYDGPLPFSPGVGAIQQSSAIETRRMGLSGKVRHRRSPRVGSVGSSAGSIRSTDDSRRRSSKKGYEYRIVSKKKSVSSEEVTIESKKSMESSQPHSSLVSDRGAEEQSDVNRSVEVSEESDMFDAPIEVDPAPIPLSESPVMSAVGGEEYGREEEEDDNEEVDVSEPDTGTPLSEDSDRGPGHSDEFDNLDF